MAAQARTAKRKATSNRTSAKTATAGGRKRTTVARRTSSTAAGKREQTVTARRASSGARGRRATVPVPVVMPRVKVMKVHVPSPGMSYVEDAGRAAAEHLPSPDRLAFYGGLGAAAVFGLIDWPVAAAIGLGTMVARRALRRRETVRTSVVSQTPATKAAPASTSTRRRTASRTGPARASRTRTTRTRTVETV